MLTNVAPVNDPLNCDAVIIPVANTSPSLLKVIPLPTTIPFLAVIKPTESILVTSSYVNVPPIETLPVNVGVPQKVVAVMIPALTFETEISSVLVNATFPVLP